MAGPSRLRPLSTHAVPTFAKSTVRDKASATNAKRPASPRSSPGKRARNVILLEEDTPAASEVSAEAGKVTYIRPPTRDLQPSVPLLAEPAVSKIHPETTDLAHANASDYRSATAQSEVPNVPGPYEQVPMANPLQVRRKAEEAILAQRRKEAEASARVEATARQAARDVVKHREIDDVEKLKRGLYVSVRHVIQSDVGLMITGIAVYVYWRDVARNGQCGRGSDRESAPEGNQDASVGRCKLLISPC